MAEKWKVEQDDHGYWHVRNADDTDDLNNHYVTDEATARLIGSAPRLKEERDALLEAAKKALRVFEVRLPQDQPTETVASLRAAIAKCRESEHA